MLKTKLLRTVSAGLCIMLMLCVSAPVSAATTGFRPDDEDLYFSALTQEIVEEVLTTEVYRSDFVLNYSCKGEIEYANVSYCMNDLPYSSVNFVRYLASNGDYVKRGDPIAEVRVSIESIALDELALEIETLEENLENYMSVNKALLKYYEDIEADPSQPASERKTAQLLYDRLSIEYEEERSDREEDIAKLRGQYDTYEAMSPQQYITAPASGIVYGLYRYRNYDSLGNYAYLCMIYDTSDVRIRVSGSNDQMHYNMPVTVAQSRSGGVVSLEGRVTTCHSSVLSPNLVGNVDYIEVDGDPNIFAIGDDVTIKFKAVDVKDALVVKKEAVYSDSKGDYVFLYTNGSSLKRYILKGNANTDLVWVVNGLEEGDEVVIK